MIIRARTVVTMNGAPIENGAVAVSEKRIVDVGTFEEINARNSGEVIDLGEQVLLPGLINAHCHLDYTCLRGKISPPRSFTEWIQAINAEKAKLLPNDYIASINDGFAEAKQFGTTAIANLTAFPELIRSVNRPIRTWWFAEMIDVREPERAKEIVERAVDALQGTENRGLAPHAPYTASANLYRYAAEVARRENFLVATHLAESSEEMQMFFNGAGPLRNFLADIGRDMSKLGGITPTQQLLRFCSPDERWVLVHMNEVTPSDLDLLVQLPDKPHIVHCPRTHEYFGHSRFQFEALRERGFNICLGTDSLASNTNLNLFAEMAALQKTEPTLPPREIIKMVTVNPARALRLSDEIGQIAPGFLADLIAIPVRPAPSGLLEEIVGFENSVSWMMADGKVVLPRMA